MKTLAKVVKDSFYAIGGVPRQIANALDPYKDA